jgi:hypothetical protein
MEQAASTDRGGPNSIFIYWFGVWGLINSKQQVVKVLGPKRRSIHLLTFHLFLENTIKCHLQ